MFTDLLRALAEDRPRTMSQLATDLGVDPGMLQLALEQCRRMGYLERLGAGGGTGCNGSCRGCGAQAASEAGCGVRAAPEAGCCEQTGPAWWQLTVAGRKIAEQAGAAALTRRS